MLPKQLIYFMKLNFNFIQNIITTIIIISHITITIENNFNYITDLSKHLNDHSFQFVLSFSNNMDKVT